MRLGKVYRSIPKDYSKAIVLMEISRTLKFCHWLMLSQYFKTVAGRIRSFDI